MNAPRGVSAIAMLLVLTAAFSAAQGQEHVCPQLTPVFAAKDPTKAFNVLILPDAFVAREDKNELPAFRCAVDRMLRGLLGSQPFRNLGCHLNFYRMDTSTSYDDVLWHYNLDKCKASDYEWPQGTDHCPDALSDPNTGDVVTLDPRSTVCPAIENETAYDRLILPDIVGQQDVVDVASNCAPDGATFQLVIIVVDTKHDAGGALPGLSPPISVVTLSDIYKPTTFFTLAHEVAHALTLHDEYTDGYDPDTANLDYRPGVNLWHPCDDNDRNGVPDGPEGIPWKRGCDPPSGQQQVKSCSNEHVDSPCGVVCADALGGTPCGISEPPAWPDVGLREGGFYRASEYFRSSDNCAMKQIGIPFCYACRCAAKAFFEAKGWVECPSWTPLCGPQPDHEILVRDCEADYGGTPSICDTWDLTPDLELIAENEEASVVRACATNIGPTEIPGDESLTLRFTIAKDLPTATNIISGRLDRPTITETTRRVKHLTGEVPIPGAWRIGERRCIEAKIQRSPPFREVALEQPESRAIALLFLSSSRPQRVRHVKDHHRLVQRLLVSMVRQLD
jgi:hypothetical protein